MLYTAPSIREKLILDLHSVQAIKFGKFRLKSGLISPYYLDLRSLVYYPYLLELTSDVFWETLRILNFDVVVGVPYTGIPIATAIGLKHDRPMVFVRKERKQYGTKKLIEGNYHPGQRAVIVDDVITTGESKLETINQLKQEKLDVKDIVVLMDRGQGGVNVLHEKGFKCHTIYNISEVFEILLLHKRINEEIVDKCLLFTKESRKQILESN